MTDPDPVRITEAVAIPEAALTWIRMSDEYTAEIRTGSVTTVGELRERLQHVPPSTPLLVSGYEGGYTTGSLGIVEVQQLTGIADYIGEFLTPDIAAAEVRGEGESGWQFTTDGEPPTLVGEPVTAVVLRRQGR